ncbi:MAG: lytic transglycosylase domain-containing protein [Actinobacteria bacterium]|nr:lytic transglycosylase domain-containing protein [Actinomycetota bacterium]
MLRTFANTTADDAQAAATDIIAAEAATLDPATNAAELSNAAVALQLGYRKLAGLDVAAENAVKDKIGDSPTRNAVATNVAAARHLIALTGQSPARDAPPAAWQIVAPAPADELLGYYKVAAANTGVPWQILASIHLVETRFGRIRGVSSAGAQGPMQFLPSTWAAYGKGDINSNHDAIAGAANYLKANGAPERLDDAIFRYNHSSNYVRAIRAYAERMTSDERAFRGYHQWAVLYRTTAGTLMLPIGYPSVPPVPVIA